MASRSYRRGGLKEKVHSKATEKLCEIRTMGVESGGGGEEGIDFSYMEVVSDLN